MNDPTTAAPPNPQTRPNRTKGEQFLDILTRANGHFVSIDDLQGRAMTTRKPMQLFVTELNHRLPLPGAICHAA
jgi:hypothetical protein